MSEPTPPIPVEDKIKTKITELEKERDKFLQDANVQLAFYQAQISMLKGLIGLEDKPAPAPKPAAVKPAKPPKEELPA